MAIFDEKIEIRERCKGVHCVDLGKSFPTHIYLQNSASIQPRTSPVQFARSPVQIPQVLDYDKDPAVQRSLRFFTLFDDVDLLVVDICRVEVNIDV